MVRSTATLKLAIVGTALGAGLLSAGCLGLETRSWPSLTAATPQVAVMDMFWYRDVKRLPDPTRNGAPSLAIGGRMYLFSSDKHGKPILGDGGVVVELFDDAPAEGAGPKLLETTNFPPEVLATMASPDSIGNGYSLVVPCRPEYR